MVGSGFDGLDALGMLDFEITGDAAQVPGGLTTHQGDFRDVLVVGQLFQPADFHMDAEADQAVFTGGVAQCIDFAGVTTVYR